MLRKLCRGIVIVAAVATVNTVRPAAAEPVSIFGGVIYYSRQNQAAFAVQLVDGEMLGEFGSNGGESWDPPHACFPCVPGSSIDPSLSESMPQSEDVTVGGRWTFRGRTYDITNLSFTIDSEFVRVPDSFDENSGGYSSAAQFALRGLVQGQALNGSGEAGLGFLGYGKARILFLPDGSWFSTTYKFEDPAAVPEPATMLLFGPGAVAALVGRRRSRGAGTGMRNPITEPL